LLVKNVLRERIAGTLKNASDGKATVTLVFRQTPFFEQTDQFSGHSLPFKSFIHTHITIVMLRQALRLKVHLDKQECTLFEPGMLSSSTRKETKVEKLTRSFSLSVVGRLAFGFFVQSYCQDPHRP
jgi:hypothetical protein